MEEPDEDDPGRRKSNPEQIIKAQRKASKVFKKINIKEDSFQQVDKERQALMQSLNKKGTDHVIFLLTNKISQLGYQTEYFDILFYYYIFQWSLFRYSDFSEKKMFNSIYADFKYGKCDRFDGM